MSENKQKPKLIRDLGMRYPTISSKKKYRYGLFMCNCGKEFKTQVRAIKRNNTKSCGCLQIENRIVHGLRNHELYNTWKNIMNRTLNRKNPSFKDYGDRGILICDRWKDVKLFIEDMYPSYKKGLSIDRIDNDGNYEPSNCRWTTNSEQSRNTRVLRRDNTSGYRGVVHHHGKWMAQIGINGKQVNLGHFTTRIEASMVFDEYIKSNNLSHSRNFNATKSS